MNLRTATNVDVCAPCISGPTSHRLEALDLLRGALMILMALDHTRDYLSNAHVYPMDPVNSWPALFATRWITHLCAPGFVAIAGTSVYLMRGRKTTGEIVHLLWTRGLWLIFLELTVVAFGWSFSLEYPTLQVIWAIGGSMLLLAALFRLPVAVVGSIGLAITLLHNTLDQIQAARFGRAQDFWELLHQAAPLHLPPPFQGFLAYPLLPWAGIFFLGYWFGVIAFQPGSRRRHFSFVLGVVLLGAFAALRISGLYGDSNHLQHLQSPVHTAMSFLVIDKYPPSLQYSLVTLGTLLLIFGVADRLVERDSLSHTRDFLEVYGRVPLFYYLLHIYLIHAATLISMMVVSHDWSLWHTSARSIPGALPGFGYSLPVVYCAWAMAVLALYLPCRAFGRLKAGRDDWWLSYI
jgi:uncharacterized membrane protein